MTFPISRLYKLYSFTMTVKEPKTIRHENVWEGKLVKNKYEKLPNSIVVLFGIFDAFLFLNLVLFPWANRSHVYCAYMWYSSRAHCSSGFTGKGLKNPDREQLSISGRSYTNTMKNKWKKKKIEATGKLKEIYHSVTNYTLKSRSGKDDSYNHLTQRIKR